MGIGIVGLTSYEFSIRLLNEKFCAVAPGTAFDTGYANAPQNNRTIERVNQLKLLNGFIRVSLANSLENVCTGITKICDLLDELQGTPSKGSGASI